MTPLEMVFAGEPLFDELVETTLFVDVAVVARDLAVVVAVVVVVVLLVLSGKCGAKFGSCRGMPGKFVVVDST